MPAESYVVSLLVKLAAIASIASILARSSRFKSILLEENRSLQQRIELALWLSVVFGASVAMRIVGKTAYQGADLGLEGSLIAGFLGGYVSGLLAGVMISLPAVAMGGIATMPLLAGVGVLAALVRDIAPATEEIWRFTPLFDLGIFRFFKSRNPRITGFHLLFCAAILFSEFIRQQLHAAFPTHVFFILQNVSNIQPMVLVAVYAATLFAVTIPLKIWNNTRNERKLEEQERLLSEARLAALTSQINPHFLFNTLNSVSSLIRTDPNQARIMVVRLSKVLRRLLRKHENFTTLREELSFIDDYLSIEVVRFGDKLRFEKDVAQDTLDMLVPSMLLQPLVENSIKHGLSTKVEGGSIRIAATRTGSRLNLVVEDDGIGIPESKLQRLLDSGIGVTNVNERMKVLFGGEYRMWVESQPGHGTRVMLEVPELETGLAAVS
ncbi:MAG TPA: histidine kinase [Bryobacteraceae bacterium]|nr:histidine kinase [Bryobacteraceae bacterium]